jgi:polyisoprenoid-binding protein YceI
VPGARPHFRVDRLAPLSELTAVADRYPVFRVLADPVRPTPPAGSRAARLGGRPPQSGRRTRSPLGHNSRRWRRWLGIIGGVLLAIVAAIELYVALQPSPAPLSLPTGNLSPPVGPTAGNWLVATGSRAGFRIPETVLLASNDIVGRTSMLTGSTRLTRTRITHITIHVDLRAITVSGKHQPAFATSLDTAQHPTATFILTQPIPLPGAFATGSATSLTAIGRLTLRGITRTISVKLTGRRSATSIQLAGSVPIRLARWHITPPSGFGRFGSLSDHATAEFLLVLQRLQ